MFKLCPIEPTDEMLYCIESRTDVFKTDCTYAYSVMTAECQTVEIVDAPWNEIQRRIEFHTDEPDQDAKWIVDLIKNHLTQNGYQIIKVKDDE